VDWSITGGLDEFYAYEDLNRLTTSYRGGLDGGKDEGKTRRNCVGKLYNVAMRTRLGYCVIAVVLAAGAGVLLVRRGVRPPPPGAEQDCPGQQIAAAASDDEKSPEHAPSAAQSLRSALSARRALERRPLDRSKSQDIEALLESSSLRSDASQRDPLDKLIAQGLDALRTEENAAAAEHFRNALAMDASHTGALYGLCEALLADEQYERAIPILEMIADVCPSDHVSRFNLGVVLSRLGRFDEAVEIYEKLLEVDEQYVQARYNLATLYQGQGRLSEAKAAWEHAIASGGELPSAYTALAEVHLDLGDAHAAMLAYSQAAKLEGDAADAWVNLAVTARAAGCGGRALMAMRKAVSIAPEDPELWSQMAEIQLHLHRQTDEAKLLRDAVRSWEKSLELNPDQPQIRDWIATYRPLVASEPAQVAGHSEQ